MTVDERVREVLVEIADGVRPAPDPYGRLRARHRRARTRAAAVGAAGLVIAAAVTVAVPLLPDRTAPTVADDAVPSGMHLWAERLRQTPVRGGLGTSDSVFVADLTYAIAEHVEAGAYGPTAPVSEVRVLYVDDVGGARVAFVALHLAKADPQTSWENASAWFVARSGASPAELADPRATGGIGDALQPFEVNANPSSPSATSVGFSIGLAPQGCVVETAPLPAIDAWKPEPTGSYVVRDAGTDRPEWWRVVCDGVVKEARPAASARDTGPVSDERLDAALRGARGPVDRELARAAVETHPGDVNQATGLPRVLWGGPISDGDAVLTATPWVGGGWRVKLDVRPNEPVAGQPVRTSSERLTSQDPTDPDSVVPHHFNTGLSVLVVVPDGATEVRAVRDGAVIDSAAVTGSAAVLAAPDGPRLTFEALDHNGKVLATARLSEELPPRPNVSSW